MLLHEQTNTQPYITEAYTTQQTDSWEHSATFVRELNYDKQFITYALERGIDPNDQYNPDYADALRDFTESILDTHDDMFEDTTKQEIRMIAGIVPIARASQTIDHYSKRRDEGKRLPDDDWRLYNDLKRRTVEYNQIANTYMYDNPEQSYSSLSEAVIGSMADYVPAHDIDALTKKAANTLRGARIEAAAHHLFDAMSQQFDITVRSGTVREDLRGADLVVETQGHTIHIDIKASLDQLARDAKGYNFEKEKKAYYICPEKPGEPRKVLLFPGLTDKNLGDSMKLSEKVTNERLLPMALQLQKIVEHLK